MKEFKINDLKDDLNYGQGIHVTHNDADAIGCATVVQLAFYPHIKRSIIHDNNFYCAIGTQDTVVKNILDEIDNGERRPPIYFIISDISISEENAERLTELQKKYPKMVLLGVDHHPTNTLHEKFPWFYVITKEFDSRLEKEILISATLSLFQILFTDKYKSSEDLAIKSIRTLRRRTNYNISGNEYKKLEMLSDIISYYDTWNWKNNPLSRNIASLIGIEIKEDIISDVSKLLGIEQTTYHLVDWIAWAPHKYYIKNIKSTWNCQNIYVFPPLIEEVYKIAQHQKESATKHVVARMITYDDRDIAITMNRSDYPNVVCQYIFDTYKDVHEIWMLYPESRQIGFRTNLNDLDLGKYAKEKFNGGGHPQAAGAKYIPEDIYIDILMQYYSGKILTLPDNN